MAIYTNPVILPQATWTNLGTGPLFVQSQSNLPVSIVVTDTQPGVSSLTMSATTGSITLTAAVPVFSPSSVGQVVTFGSGVTGQATITGYTSTTVVTATVTTTLSATTATIAQWSTPPNPGMGVILNGVGSSINITHAAPIYAVTIANPDTTRTATVVVMNP